jgi:hypothetical protein
MIKHSMILDFAIEAPLVSCFQTAVTIQGSRSGPCKQM